MSEIGKLLRELRGNLSLRQASQRIGISHVHLDNIEKGYDRRSGKQVHPSVATIQLIARGYNYPYKDLMRAAGYLEEEDEEIAERYSLNELPEQERVFFKDWEKYTTEEIEEAREWIEFKRQQRRKNEDR